MFSTGGGGDGSSKPQTEEEIKQALREREHALRLQLKAFVSSTEFNGRSTTDFYGFGKVRAGLVKPSHHHKSTTSPYPSSSSMYMRVGHSHAQGERPGLALHDQ